MMTVIAEIEQCMASYLVQTVRHSVHCTYYKSVESNNLGINNRKGFTSEDNILMEQNSS